MEPGLGDLQWECMVHTAVSALQFLGAKNMAVVPHPCYLLHLALCYFSLFLRMGVLLLECPWNLGSHIPSYLWSQKLVQVLLDPLSKPRKGLLWRGQQWPVTELRIYSIIDYIQELLDMPLYVWCLTQIYWEWERRQVYHYHMLLEHSSRIRVDLHNIPNTHS